MGQPCVILSEFMVLRVQITQASHSCLFVLQSKVAHHLQLRTKIELGAFVLAYSFEGGAWQGDMNQWSRCAAAND